MKTVKITKTETPLFTDLTQKDLLKKYKTKIKDEEKDKKNELLLERIKRKDDFIHSHFQKEKEKQREYKSYKIKSKAIEDVINKTFQMDIRKKIKMTSTNKIETKYILDEVKRDKFKSESKNVEKRIEEEINKINNLDEELNKLKVQEGMILKYSQVLNSTISYINNDNNKELDKYMKRVKYNVLSEVTLEVA
jgi:hypothetical protein